MKNKIFITVLFLVTNIVSFAQFQKHQIGVFVGGGIQTLLYKPLMAEHKQGFGATMSFDYRYFINKQWSVGTGIGLSSYAAKAEINASVGETHYDDINIEDFEYKTAYNDWTEKQNLLQMEIPIAVYYHYTIKNDWMFLGGLGVKTAFPVFNNYKVTGENYVTTGYYESTGVEYRDMPQHGFYTQEADLKGKSDMHIADILLFTDLGVTHTINSSTDFFIGLYCSYGLTSQINDSDDSLFSAEDYTGMLSSSEVNTLHNFAMGLKVGVLKKIGTINSPLFHRGK